MPNKNQRDQTKPVDNPDTPIQQENQTVVPTQQINTASTNNQETAQIATSNEEIDKNNLVGSGVYMNTNYALVDQQISDGVVVTNGGSYKISIFLSPKFLTSSDIFTNNQNVFLKYNDTVTSICLQDNIDNIGLSGYIDVNNISSSLDIFLERHNNYYVIINFTKYQNDENGNQIATIKYQPYIFDIDYIENVGSANRENKRLRIWLVDVVTSILKRHSIASVIKRNKSLTSSTSYKEVFQEIMEYVRDYIKVNTNNKYQYNKPLLFKHDTKCIGFAKNGNDEGNDMSELVKASFKKISKNASIYQALDVLLRDCCTTLKTPASFKERYMNIGDVLIPFFFKEEYPDPQFLYTSMWSNEEPSSTQSQSTEMNVSQNKSNTTNVSSSTSQSKPVGTSNSQSTRNRDVTNSSDTPVENNGDTQSQSGFVSSIVDGVTQLFKTKRQLNKTVYDELYNQSYGGKAKVLINRQMTMRDLYMPFFVAFGSDEYTCVYQDINPSKNNLEDKVVPLLGVYQGDLKSFQFNPIDMNSVSKLWKNVIFLDCSDGAICANSTLIFFSWFFDYFQEVFLNAVYKPLCSNVMPDFFMLSRNEGIKHAKGQGDTFENKFDQMNSYTYATQTQDSVKQCLRVMGKNLASFILINDRYTFRVNGNLFRRPNEIIRLGYRGFGEDGGMQMVSYHTGLNFNDMTYLYVRRVTHYFVGTTYDNVVQCCKFCEVLDNSLVKNNIQKQ